MCDDGNTYRTDDKTSKLFDSSGRVQFQQCSNLFQSSSTFSGIDTSSNIIARPTSAHGTIPSTIATHIMHSQTEYFSPNTMMRNPEEHKERHTQCGFEAYYDSHENQNQSCKIFESRYVPHNNQPYENPDHTLREQSDGMPHHHEICTSGVLKRNENGHCAYSRVLCSTSRNGSSEFNEEDSLKSVSKSGSSMNMIDCADMIHEDEINDMLTGYLGSYNPQGEPNKPLEKKPTS